MSALALSPKVEAKLKEIQAITSARSGKVVVVLGQLRSRMGQPTDKAIFYTFNRPDWKAVAEDSLNVEALRIYFEDRLKTHRKSGRSLAPQLIVYAGWHPQTRMLCHWWDLDSDTIVNFARSVSA